MPEEINVSTTTETNSSASSDAQAGSNTSTNATQNTQGNTQSGTTSIENKILGGDGDIQKAENYLDGLELPEETKAKIAERIQYGMKTRQSVADKALAKKVAEMTITPKRLKEMIENDENGIKTALLQEMESEAKMQQIAEDPITNFRHIADNWEKIPKDKQTEIYGSLSPEQQLTLQNTLTLRHAKLAESKVAVEKIHTENVSKYGKEYEESAPKFMEYFEQNYYKNAPEFVYKAMNYDSYGKQMYEKGLKERQLGVPPINNGMKQGKTDSKYKSVEDSLRQYMEQNNIPSVDSLLKKH